MNIPEIHNRIINGQEKIYDNLILAEVTTGETYTASNGVEITNGDIQAKIDNDTITINDDGELCAGNVVGEASGIHLQSEEGITKISSQINGKDVSAAYKSNNGIKEGLIINGGPLATQFKQIYPGGIVPVGTTIESLISKLIYAVNFPTISQSPTFTAAIAAPTITFSPATASVEIGTTVSWTITNYILGLQDKVVDPTDIVQSVKVNVTANGQSGNKANSTTHGVFTASRTYSTDFTPTVGTNGKTTVTDETGTVHAGQNVKVSGSFKVTSEGTYTITAKNTSATITADKYNQEIDTVKAVSNTGEVSDEVFSVKFNGDLTIAPENSASKSVSGFYKIYWGSLGTKVTADDTLKPTDVTLAKIKTLNVINGYSSNIGEKTFDANKYCIIALPHVKGVTRVYGIDSLSQAEVNFFTYESTVSGFGADGTLVYDVFYFDNGASTPYTLKNISFS